MSELTLQPSVTALKDDGPDMAGEILGTRFRRYTSPAGVCGLYRSAGTRLDLLVVLAEKRGSGRFRKFISDCKNDFTTICIWHIDNPFLGMVLDRYGFKNEIEPQGTGEVLIGKRWDKENT